MEDRGSAIGPEAIAIGGFAIYIAKGKEEEEEVFFTVFTPACCHLSINRAPEVTANGGLRRGHGGGRW